MTFSVSIVQILIYIIVGYYEFTFNGEPAVLCHGVGHLAQLVPAKSYDEKYEKWDLSVYPCIPDTFRAAPKAATIKCLKLVKSFFDKADWLINATDPDREEGCKFHINRSIAGKTITEKQAILLCQKGMTNIIKGFKSKKGSEFDAYLIVNKEKEEVSFMFPEVQKNSYKKGK